jgi:hypothetical protein
VAALLAEAVAATTDQSLRGNDATKVDTSGPPPARRQVRAKQLRVSKRARAATQAQPDSGHDRTIPPFGGFKESSHSVIAGRVCRKERAAMWKHMVRGLCSTRRSCLVRVRQAEGVGRSGTRPTAFCSISHDRIPQILKKFDVSVYESLALHPLLHQTVTAPPRKLPCPAPFPRRRPWSERTVECHSRDRRARSAPRIAPPAAAAR